MLNNFFQILDGFTHCLLSVKTLFELNIKSIKNLFLLFVMNLLVLYVPKYMILYYNNRLFTFFYNIYITPMFLIMYIFSLDKLNKIFSVNMISKKNITIVTKNNVSIYFKCISLIYYLFTNLLLYIPYIGFLFGLIVASHSYGYYSLEYVSSHNKLTPIEKISLIENNSYFYIGYGSILGLSLIYLPFIEQHLFFLILFPLNTIYLSEIKKIHINKKFNDINTSIFILPIYILNFAIDLIIHYFNL